jgi:hypothetical protein
MVASHKFGARPVLVTQRVDNFGPEHLHLAAIALDGATLAFNGGTLDSNPHCHGTVEHKTWSKAFSDTAAALAAPTKNFTMDADPIADKAQFRVWPHGTVQAVDDGEPYDWLSDDFAVVWAYSDEDALTVAGVA